MNGIWAVVVVSYLAIFYTNNHLQYGFPKGLLSATDKQQNKKIQRVKSLHDGSPRTLDKKDSIKVTKTGVIASIRYANTIRKKKKGVDIAPQIHTICTLTQPIVQRTDSRLLFAAAAVVVVDLVVIVLVSSLFALSASLFFLPLPKDCQIN